MGWQSPAGAVIGDFEIMGDPQMPAEHLGAIPALEANDVILLVSSEPVSERRIPCWPHGASTAAKKGIKSERYEPIPYASEQGIFCGLAGNLNRRSGKFPP